MHISTISGRIGSNIGGIKYMCDTYFLKRCGQGRMWLTTETILEKYMFRPRWIFLEKISREQYLESCECPRFLLSLGIASLDRPYVEYFGVRVLLPMRKFGEALTRCLLQYLYQKRATWRAQGAMMATLGN